METVLNARREAPLAYLPAEESSSTSPSATLRPRFGIVTAGGDCPGLNPVIRSMVIRARQIGWDVVGIRDSFCGLLESPIRTQTLDRESVRGILTKGGTILGTRGGANPFEYPNPTLDGEMRFEDRSDELIETMRLLEMDGLVVLGGDGSLATAHRLSQKGVKVIVVPKTIDNDILGTDVSFGFQTAVDIATQSVDRLHSTAESHDRVMVVEVMGRDCGWIALHVGIAGGAGVILIPEIPYDLDRIILKIRRRQAKKRYFSIVVVAEGALCKGDTPRLLENAGPGGKKRRFGGAGEHIAEQIHGVTGMDCRVTVLGHLQRGGTPLSCDRLLAARYGIAAMEMIEQDRWGCFVGLQGPTHWIRTVRATKSWSIGGSKTRSYLTLAYGRCRSIP
jgi:ATP-dependent phosphofructokinase / diphosphate-dependent phosphofructokinase